METPLKQVQQQAGAIWALGAETTVPLTYGNDDLAYEAARQGVALVDRSHWGRLRVSDRDGRRFLHNQTTNQIEQLPPGHSCQTVFVTSTGRTLDLATVHGEQDSFGLWVSPGQAEPLMAWMDRYIFFADQVKLVDETATTVAFTLIGPGSAACLERWGLSALPPDQSHSTVTQGDVTLHLATDTGLGLPGYTLTLAPTAGATVWTALMAAGAVPLGETTWQRLRIEQGRPQPGQELTENYNPLEAGLWHAVSFNKGCYIGQETIARLQTYQGVKQQLWGLQLTAPVAPGTAIAYDGIKAGRLTSVITTPEGVRGLGYVRTKIGGAGLTVTVGEAQGKVVDIPFASRGYLAAEDAAQNLG